MNLTLEQFETVSRKLFKTDIIKTGVWAVIHDGKTCYQAEIDYEISKNSLTKHVKKLKKEIEYLEELGL